MCLIALVTATLAWSPAAVLALGEQLGRLKGRVTNDRGSPVSGATVVIEGEALIGEPRTATTDSRGRFLFQRLPPGPYEVVVTVDEEEPLLRRVTVEAGGVASVKLRTSDVEVMEITGAMNTQPDSTRTGTFLDAKTLEKTVIRYFGDVAENVPGVMGRNATIKGGNSSHNRLLVDGLDITGRGGNVIPFDAVGSMDILTGGGEAQYNALGGVISTMTGDGSDVWRANASLYLVQHWMFERSKFGSGAYSYRRPFSEPSEGRGGNYIASLNVGGPIVKDRLWFDAAYKILQNRNPTFLGGPLGVPPYNIQHPPSKYSTHGARIKLQYAPTLRHRLRLSANTSPAWWDNTTRSNNRLGVAESGGVRGVGFMIGAWDFQINDDVSTTLQMGLTKSLEEWGPQGWLRPVDYVGCQLFSEKNCYYDPDRPRHVNAYDGSVWYQGGDQSVSRKTGLQFDPSISIHSRFAGTHDIKVGIQAAADYQSTWKGTPGGLHGVVRSQPGSGTPRRACPCPRPSPGPTPSSFQRAAARSPSASTQTRRCPGPTKSR